MSENKRVIGAASGALGLGGLATALGTCCGAPWAVSLLGVSGAIALARLEGWQPYLLLAALILLGLAFFMAYRSRPARADGSCNVTSRRRLRWIVWMAAILMAGLALISFLPELQLVN